MRSVLTTNNNPCFEESYSGIAFHPIVKKVKYNKSTAHKDASIPAERQDPRASSDLKH